MRNLMPENKEGQLVTGVCCQFRGRASYVCGVLIVAFVLRGRVSGEIATEQQPPIHYVHLVSIFKLIKMTLLPSNFNNFQIFIHSFPQTPNLFPKNSVHPIQPNRVSLFSAVYFIIFIRPSLPYYLLQTTSYLSYYPCP